MNGKITKTNDAYVESVLPDLSRQMLDLDQACFVETQRQYISAEVYRDRVSERRLEDHLDLLACIQAHFKQLGRQAGCFQPVHDYLLPQFDSCECLIQSP
jgi:hypothetical protein